MKRYVVGFLVVGGAWFCYVVARAACGHAAAVAPIGLALSPVGWGLAGLALMLGFKQREEDELSAHRERLASAYSTWFSETWPKIDKASMNLRFQVSRPKPHLSSIAEAVAAPFALERDLRIAANPPLMLERDQGRADRLRATCARFPSWGKGDPNSPEANQAYVEWAKNLATAVEQCCADIDGLYKDVVNVLSAAATRK